MPVGTITSRYTAQQLVLRAHALSVALEATGALQRGWYVPDPNGWEGEIFDIAGVSSAFDRSEVAALYQTALMTVLGAGGDAMALKLQSDYLAVQERAWRLRHLSPIRAVMHAGARRIGHSTGQVGAFDRVTQYIADLLISGVAGWQPPQNV